MITMALEALRTITCGCGISACLRTLAEQIDAGEFHISAAAGVDLLTSTVGYGGFPIPELRQALLGRAANHVNIKMIAMAA